jgi:hypothetical protein
MAKSDRQAQSKKSANAGRDGSGETQRQRHVGKRSDPAYGQYSIYLKKATHHAIKRALMDANLSGDFSDLVEELLEEWLATRVPTSSRTQ